MLVLLAVLVVVEVRHLVTRVLLVGQASLAKVTLEVLVTPTREHLVVMAVAAAGQGLLA